ncbi:hypothetical protein CBR_g37110 [Chara braunii]|uniref:Uncharacterized protein n=1 Tax=Chara braunii TaxID=69332 RepID=A0A388LM36_CHABU|nr:hypothetical protein CBR_g37110 [Chara braunii]|eukprot:GBG83396.1 hypothetical protein CBR_g37110 [Chara braunii]
MCYDEGICPEDVPFEDVVIDGNEAVVTVDKRFDEIKIQWLKERTVVVIFRDEARELPRRVKEDIVRAYENGWKKDVIFDPPVGRGRVKFEAANVISYVSRDKVVADWMISEGSAEVKLKGKRYVFETKPWMPRAEWKEFRRLEMENTFWVLAIQVPLDAYCYLRASITKVIGPVTKMESPDQVNSNPKLLNVKCEIEPEFRSRFKDRLWVCTIQGDMVEVKLASADTPYCTNCKWYFHTDEQCTRNRDNPNGRRSRFRPNRRAKAYESDEDSTSVSSSSRSDAGSLNHRRRGGTKYKGPLSHQNSRNTVMRSRTPSPPPPSPRPLPAAGPTAGLNSIVNLVFSPGPLQEHDPYEDYRRSGMEHQPRTQREFIPPPPNPYLESAMVFLLKAAAPLGGSEPAPPDTEQDRSHPQIGGLIRPNPTRARPGSGNEEGIETTWVQESQPRPPMHEAAATSAVEVHGRSTRGQSPLKAPRTVRSSTSQQLLLEAAPRAECPTAERSQRSMSSKAESSSSAHSERSAHSVHSGSRLVTPQTGVKTSRSRRAITATKAQTASLEKWLVLLICSIVNGAIHVIAWQPENSKTTFLSQKTEEPVTPQTILTAAKNIFKDKFPLRMVPDMALPRFYQEQTNRTCKIFTLLLDAFISTDKLEPLLLEGLRMIPLSIFIEEDMDSLQQMQVLHVSDAGFLSKLNEKLPRNKQLQSLYLNNTLAQKWAPSSSAGPPARSGARQAHANGIPIQSRGPGPRMNG